MPYRFTDEELSPVETAAALGLELGQEIKSISDRLDARGIYVYHASGGFPGFWCDLAKIAIVLDAQFKAEFASNTSTVEWPDVVTTAAAFISETLVASGELPDPDHLAKETFGLLRSERKGA